MITRKSKHEFRVSFPRMSSNDVHTMRDWCRETFGEGGRNPKCQWRYGWTHHDNDIFYFRTEKDALYFDLRWA